MGRPCSYRCNKQDIDLGLVSDTAVEVRSNASLLNTALDKLIDNAIRCVGWGERIRLSAAVQGEQLVIAVEDSGPGISPDERDRIFDRFERGANAAASVGSGLGLAIARDIARLLGGDLTVQVATSGRGCRFELSLG